MEECQKNSKDGGLIMAPHNEPRKRVMGPAFFPLICAGMLLLVAIAVYQAAGISVIFAVVCGCVTSCLHAAWHNYKLMDPRSHGDR